MKAVTIFLIGIVIFVVVGLSIWGIVSLSEQEEAKKKSDKAKKKAEEAKKKAEEAKKKAEEAKKKADKAKKKAEEEKSKKAEEEAKKAEEETKKAEEETKKAEEEAKKAEEEAKKAEEEAKKKAEEEAKKKAEEEAKKKAEEEDETKDEEEDETKDEEEDETKDEDYVRWKVASCFGPMVDGNYLSGVRYACVNGNNIVVDGSKCGDEYVEDVCYYWSPDQRTDCCPGDVIGGVSVGVQHTCLGIQDGRSTHESPAKCGDEPESTCACYKTAESSCFGPMVDGTYLPGVRYACLDIDDPTKSHPTACGEDNKDDVCYYWQPEQRADCCSEGVTNYPGGFPDGISMGVQHTCRKIQDGSDISTLESPAKCGSGGDNTCACYVWNTSTWSVNERDPADIPPTEWLYQFSS